MGDGSPIECIVVVRCRDSTAISASSQVPVCVIARLCHTSVRAVQGRLSLQGVISIGRSQASRVRYTGQVARGGVVEAGDGAGGIDDLCYRAP